MAGFWRELWPRLPQWPCLASRCASSSADHIGTKTEAESRNDEAERDIRRLKWNWLFTMLVSMIGSLNTCCILPTNHQYIVNPTDTDDVVNITNEKIEPGLELSEEIYTLSYALLFAGNSLAALACGILFNLIPTWYLFLTSIVIHIIAFVFYPLATSSWMMLLSRTLAGLATGTSVTVTFSYFGVSYMKYVENLKQLDQYEERTAARTKGFVFSLFNVGNVIGYTIGGGFPIILAQFPETPQFRTAGWFCLAVGVVLLVLLLVLFHGECAWQPYTRLRYPRRFPSCTRKRVDEKLFFSIVIPAYVIMVGGVKGIRYLLPTKMMTPIVADAFGYSERDAVYLTTIFFVGTVIGLVLTYTLQFFKVSSYSLTVTGLVCTIIGLLVMTDWQAIGNDPCTAYSILHHPELLEFYKQELTQQEQEQNRLCSSSTGRKYDNSSIAALLDAQETTCSLVTSCESGMRGKETDVKAIFQVEYVETPQAEVCFHRIQSGSNEVRVQSLRTVESLSESSGAVHCTSSDVGSEPSRTASSCFLLHKKSNVSIDRSLLTWVHMQSLQVVEREVYQMAVNRCESAGEHCHWIPNSPVTGKHCSDCQPICRDTRRTLNFAQFGIGLVFFFSTLTFLFTGAFLLLSDTVSKSYQGISMAMVVALSGVLKMLSPWWMTYLYEVAEKRTYLLMLTLVGIFLPLLIGLLLLYPWVMETITLNQTPDTDEEETELIPAGTSSYTDSDE